MRLASSTEQTLLFYNISIDFTVHVYKIVQKWGKVMKFESFRALCKFRKNIV